MNDRNGVHRSLTRAQPSTRHSHNHPPQLLFLRPIPIRQTDSIARNYQERTPEPRLHNTHLAQTVLDEELELDMDTVRYLKSWNSQPHIPRATRGNVNFFDQRYLLQPAGIWKHGANSLPQCRRFQQPMLVSFPHVCRCYNWHSVSVALRGRESKRPMFGEARMEMAQL